MKRLLFLLLIFLSFTGLSQSVHIDGATGRIDDLHLDTLPEGTDLIYFERSDTSMYMTYDYFTNMPHGAFAFNDSSITPAMSTNTWVQITNATNTLFVSEDHELITFAGDSITIIYGGDYISFVSLSFGGTAGDFFEISMFKNGAQTYSTIERTTSQTDVGNMFLPAYLFALVAGDDIAIKIRNTASNDDATIISCSWVIWRLHI